MGMSFMEYLSSKGLDSLPTDFQEVKRLTEEWKIETGQVKASDRKSFTHTSVTYQVTLPDPENLSDEECRALLGHLAGKTVNYHTVTVNGGQGIDDRVQETKSFVRDFISYDGEAHGPVQDLQSSWLVTKG